MNFLHPVRQYVPWESQFVHFMWLCIHLLYIELKYQYNKNLLSIRCLYWCWGSSAFNTYGWIQTLLKINEQVCFMETLDLSLIGTLTEETFISLDHLVILSTSMVPRLNFQKMYYHNLYTVYQYDKMKFHILWQKSYSYRPPSTRTMTAYIKMWRYQGE